MSEMLHGHTLEVSLKWHCALINLTEGYERLHAVDKETYIPGLAAVIRRQGKTWHPVGAGGHSCSRISILSWN